MNDRELVTQDILNMPNTNLLIELPTGYGKTLIAIELLKKHLSKGNVLIVVPKNILKKNFMLEINKWWKNRPLNFTFTTYISLHKYIGNWYAVIYDEAHHLTQRCIDVLKDIHSTHSILLSATVPKNLKDKLIDLFGADHHGYIARIKSSMKSLGYNPDNLEVKLVQMVRLFKDGAEYKMSKRTGNAVSMKELIEEVGVDAVRYFFNSRASSQHLDFDLDLAKTMGSTNPVYYCQYAHARLSTLISMGKDQGFDIDVSGNGLVDDSEIALMKSLAEYKKVVEDAALSYSPHKITIYVRKLASDVNDFYTRCRVLDKENKEITSARLGLCLASKIVLQDGLSLLGVNAPDHM